MFIQLINSVFLLVATNIFTYTLLKMFFTFIGLCLFLYFLFYVICFCIFDCDVLTGLAAKFGKPISKYRSLFTQTLCTQIMQQNL